MLRSLIIAAALVAPLAVGSLARADEHAVDHLVDDGPGGSPADTAHVGAHGGGHGGEELNFADFSYKEHHKDPPLLFALINFGLLLALLGWKAAPALREYWAKKSDTIRDGLEEGARLRKEAEAKLAEYNQRIKDVDAEVAALIADIKAEADAEKQRILSDAAAQAEATRKAADERIAADIQRARREIEREVVTAAVTAAEKILRDKMGPQDQQQLVQSFITQLESAPTATHDRSPA